MNLTLTEQLFYCGTYVLQRQYFCSLHISHSDYDNAIWVSGPTESACLDARCVWRVTDLRVQRSSSLASFCSFHAWLTILPRRLKPYIPPKRRAVSEIHRGSYRRYIRLPPRLEVALFDFISFRPRTALSSLQFKQESPLVFCAPSQAQPVHKPSHWVGFDPTYLHVRLVSDQLALVLPR
jgi:hypothetical protein